ncbi:hypothetical protein OAA53_02545 [Salibacteraceae bacterium]|nr:hypothetical protein [Salibacteraceae bacterium]
MMGQKPHFTTRSGLNRQTIGLFYLPLIMAVVFIGASYWSAVGLVASVLLSLYIANSIPNKVDVFSDRIDVHYMFSKKSFTVEQIQAIYLSKTIKGVPVVSLAATNRKGIKVIPINPKKGERESIIQHFSDLHIKIVRD